MALTRNLNRTGRAASVENRERREAIYEMQRQEIKRRLEDQMVEAREELKQLDPDGWEVWWDSDALPDAPFAVMLPVIQARIAEIKRLRAIFSCMKK